MEYSEYDGHDDCFDCKYIEIHEQYYANYNNLYLCLKKKNDKNNFGFKEIHSPIGKKTKSCFEKRINL